MVSEEEIMKIYNDKIAEGRIKFTIHTDSYVYGSSNNYDIIFERCDNYIIKLTNNHAVVMYIGYMSEIKRFISDLLNGKFDTERMEIVRLYSEIRELVFRTPELYHFKILFRDPDLERFAVFFRDRDISSQIISSKELILILEDLTTILTSRKTVSSSLFDNDVVEYALCTRCNGTGRESPTQSCPECNGSGKYIKSRPIKCCSCSCAPCEYISDELSECRLSLQSKGYIIANLFSNIMSDCIVCPFYEFKEAGKMKINNY
jgi:hypothetical protein